MTTTEENIQKKEKFLADAMKRVLDTPLQPLSEALDNIKKITSVQKEIIKTISDEVGASGNDIEDIKKSVNSITKTDFPTLKSKIEQENQKLTASINEKSIQYTADLQSTSTKLFSIISEIHNKQEELEERLEKWNVELCAINETSKEQQSTTTQAITNAIFSNRELIEKIRADLSNQITASHTTITSEATAANTYINKKIEEQMAVVQHVISDLKNNFESKNSTLVDIFNQQNKNIEKEIVLTHKKIKKLIVFFSIFFVLMLTHVGYDILSRFH